MDELGPGEIGISVGESGPRWVGIPVGAVGATLGGDVGPLPNQSTANTAGEMAS